MPEQRLSRTRRAYETDGQRMSREWHERMATIYRDFDRLFEQRQLGMKPEATEDPCK